MVCAGLTAASLRSASSGFGLILSHRLAARGTRVIMADVNMAGEKEASELNRKFGTGTAVFVQTDVAQAGAVEHLFDVGVLA